MNVVAVIPAHLASVRFPRKVLYKFFDLPMIEHVRRRALLSKEISDVIVATPDDEIADVVRSFGGVVMKTSNDHINGTTRVAEVARNIDCSHVLLLQGDEPLLLPNHIDKMVSYIKKSSNGDAWNATADINEEEELERHSFVKCAVSNNRILHCFRKTPYFSEFDIQKEFVRKILGLIGYKKEFLINLAKLKQSPIEIAEFIEQMRIIENGYTIESVNVDRSLPSVNEPHEADLVIKYIESDELQQKLLKSILDDN